MSVWIVEYFNNSNTQTWPGKVKFNGTYITVQGCNTFSIPIKMDLNSSKVQTSPTGFISTRLACGNVDQPFIGLITNSTSYKSYGN